MKHLYVLLLGIALLPFGANAQFSEDFNGVPTTSGIGSLPAGWTLYDQDGNTPHPQVSFIDAAWKVAVLTGGNQVAISTSYYNPPGQSDDWMVTPQISVPATSPFLIFEAMAPNQNYADDYEVLISTTGSTPADFSTVIHSETSPPGTLTPVAIDLSAYAGQQVYIAFRNVANDELYLFIDNIKVLTLPNDNLGVTGVELQPYSATNTNNTLDITIKNFGANVINTADIDWSDGTNNYTYTATGLNLQPYSTTTVSHSAPVNYTSVVEKTITVTASNINGNTDSDPSDNTASTIFHTVSQVPAKYVVIEEGTGTWCGWCPRGVVAMEYMYANPALFPNFIGIAVHNGDPMVVTEYDNGAGISGFPGCNIDRVEKGAPVTQTGWVNSYNNRKDIVSPAEVSITAGYDETTREITASVSADFYTNFAQADMRLSVVVVEDGVTGTSGGYAQTNYYAGGGQGAMGGYESLPDPVPASQMIYDRVGIALLGGYDGEASSIPTAINDGDTANYSFTYTLPTDSDPSEINLVALLIDQGTGAILNANEVDLGTFSIENPVAINDIKVYPNPASEFMNISFGVDVPSDVNLNIYSTTGALVKTLDFENVNGKQEVHINVSDLSTGEYLVSLSTNEGAVVKTILVE